MKISPVFYRDTSILLGGGCLIGGCWLAWPPLGLIVAGLATLALGVFSQLDAERKQAAQQRKKRWGT